MKGEEKSGVAGTEECADDVGEVKLVVDEDGASVDVEGIEHGVDEEVVEFADAPSFQSDFLTAFLNSSCDFGALSHRML